MIGECPLMMQHILNTDIVDYINDTDYKIYSLCNKKTRLHDII